jgi:hypothetical protein
MLEREDLNDERNPNPDKREQYQQPELTSERIPGRSFAGENVAATQRDQARTRNSGPPDRGNRTDDVQASDRAGAVAEGEADDADRAHRANSARTGLDAERRAETDENL